MEYKDYYATLGVPRDAEAKQIREAFRKLARKHHPDVNPGDKSAEAKFKEINEAYEVLSDTEKRGKYDRLGADWERIERDEELRRRYAAAGAESGEDLGDFFSTFFGGGGGHRTGGWETIFGAEPAARGMDVEVEIAVSLEEAAKGATRSLDLHVQDTCPQCKGQGVVAGEARAQGGVRVTYNARQCPRCHGAGTVPGRRTVKVRIPAGITEGTSLRVAGHGGRGVNGTAGDLYVRVRFAPHRVFTAKGRDLWCDLPIWDFEAALGTEADAPTLGGRVRVKIPPGSQSGQTLRLRGKGLPGPRGGAGDLHYVLKIVVPSHLESEERRLLTELQRLVTEKRPNPREALLRREP